jgi:hypothetical protein
MPTFDLFDVSSSDISSILASPAPTYVLVDQTSLNDQWLGQAPDQNFLSLRDGAGLTPLGSRGSYMFFHVNGL